MAKEVKNEELKPEEKQEDINDLLPSGHQPAFCAAGSAAAGRPL